MVRNSLMLSSHTKNSLLNSPGRFFASTELKSLLANFVYIYDMKMEKEGVVPPPTWITTNVMPSQTAEVMFRKRQN